MKISLNKQRGFSIIEVTVVVAVLLILAAAFLTIADKIENHGKEMLTRSTIQIIETALEQYEQSATKLHDSSNATPSLYRYSFYKYPFDLREYTTAARDKWQDNDGHDDSSYDNDDYLAEVASDFKSELEDAFTLTVTDSSNPVFTKADEQKNKIDNRYCYGHVAMVVLLNHVPECRDILDSISSRNIKTTDENGKLMTLEIDGRGEAIYLITDGWGVPLRYWYDGEQPFPVIESAGPDGKFDTEDDLIN